MKKRNFVTLELVIVLALTFVGSIDFASADPPPEEFPPTGATNYLASVYTTTPPAIPNPLGYVLYPHAVEGGSKDGQWGNYAYMYTEYGTQQQHPYRYAAIAGHMNAVSAGLIWVHCGKEFYNANEDHTDPYNPNNFGLMIYTSNSPDGPWNLVGTLWVPNRHLGWVKMGVFSEGFDWGADPPEGYSGAFTYIQVTLQSTSSGTNPYRLNIDAVAACPYVAPPAYYPPYGYYGVPVQFNLVDTNGYPVAGEIYLDGYLIGYTSTTIYLMSYYELGRPYQLSVIAYGDYTFLYHYDIYQSSSYDNPADFYVLQPNYVVSVFAPT